MDSPNTIRTFKYKTSQQPIFSVKETPLQYRSFAPVLDVSFSSYLKPEEPANGSKVDDAEINVFDAHKYFSESNDLKASKRGSLANQKTVESGKLSATVARLSSVSSVDGYGRNFRTSSARATPTASSEASWNSQTGLLTNPPGSIAVSLKNLPADHDKRRGSTAAKWKFCGKCPCTGKKAVQVEEASSEHRAATNTRNSNPKTDSYIKAKSHKHAEITVEKISHKHAEITVEKISSISEKSSVTSDLLERQLRVTSNLLRLSSESNFPCTAARQQRVSMSGRAFGDGATGFSFPILSPSYPAKPALENSRIPKKSITPLEDPARYSIEVFQPTGESISRKSMDAQINTLASIPGVGTRDSRRCQFPGNSISGVTPPDQDDIGSDASSDLFEIESFSTQTTTYPMYHRRDSLDDAPTFNARQIAAKNGGGIGNGYPRTSLDEPETPSIAPTECYAPSEVSIDWSVTTAEGFDRASVANYSVTASEIGNVKSLMRHGGENNHGNGGGNIEGGKRKGNGLLSLSCRHEEAVSVGPRPIKCAPGGPPFPLISISEHVSSRPHKATKPPLAKPHSATLSLAFAT